MSKEKLVTLSSVELRRRIGTKEMAFYPERFDETFLAMLDAFHKAYPEVGLHIMVHFEHPDEFLMKDDNGDYIQDENVAGMRELFPQTRRVTVKDATHWVHSQKPDVFTAAVRRFLAA